VSEAIQAINKALNLDPTVSELYRINAYHYQLLANYDEGMKNIERAVLLGDSDKFTRANHAILLHKTGSIKESLRCFSNLYYEGVLDSFTPRSQALFLHYMIVVYEQCGRYVESLIFKELFNSLDCSKEFLKNHDNHKSQKIYFESLSIETVKVLHLSKNTYGSGYTAYCNTFLDSDANPFFPLIFRTRLELGLEHKVSIGQVVDFSRFKVSLQLSNNLTQKLKSGLIVGQLPWLLFDW
jgi:hypothetical protein